MFTGSYPKPTIPWPHTLPAVRNLEPILSPPPSLHTPLPPLPPTRTFPSLLSPEWHLTTHLVPAAYPRTTPLVPVPTVPAFTPGKSKEERRREVEALADELAEAKYRQGTGELDARGMGRDGTGLWCCVSRYVRSTRQNDSKRKGVTLFFAHANGFPKEIWEPTLLHLMDAMHSRNASYEVAEIWCFEAANHSDAALVNAGKLSGMYDWQDNARDLANFLMHYLPNTSTFDALPIHLPRVSMGQSTTRAQHGFVERTLVGVGHSFGGASIVWASSHQPYKRLFDSVVLVDPMCVGAKPGPDGNFGKYLNRMIIGALLRRDHWTSKEEALRLFQATPFFQRWNPDVLKVYVECGTYDHPEGGVRLKTQPIHEAITFAEQLSAIESWFHLPNIDERIELKFVMPAGNGEPGGPEKVHEKQCLVWQRPVNCSNVINPHAGHLIAQETPGQLAVDIHEFLQKKYAVLKNRL